MPITVAASKWLPHVNAAVTEADLRFPGLSWGTYNGHHPTIARAADGMVPAWAASSGNARGWEVAHWLQSNAVRLGVWYVIFDGRIWSRTRPNAGWLKYFDADNPNPNRSHKNHVHVSFYKTAPSSIPVVAPPAPGWDGVTFPGRAVFEVGKKHPAVTLLDHRLLVHGYVRHHDGNGYQPGPMFTEDTRLNVEEFQIAQGWTGNSATGIPGPATWARLMAGPVMPPPPVIDVPSEVEPVGNGISLVVGASLNCRWPRYGSSQNAAPWSERAPAIAKSLRDLGADWWALQEAGEEKLGGQAGDVFERLGDYAHYQAHGLNAVGWDDRRFLYVDTQEITLKAFGQWPGRTCVAVKLRERTTGFRLRIASTHLAASSKSPAVSKAQARKFRGHQIQQVIGTLNDDVDDWPTYLALDGNSTAADVSADSPRVRARGYGWRWPADLKGIDLVMCNYGARIDSSKHIEMGTLSDHDGRLVVGHTDKP